MYAPNDSLTDSYTESDEFFDDVFRFTKASTYEMKTWSVRY